MTGRDPKLAILLHNNVKPHVNILDKIKKIPTQLLRNPTLLNPVLDYINTPKLIPNINLRKVGEELKLKNSEFEKSIVNILLHMHSYQRRQMIAWLYTTSHTRYDDWLRSESDTSLTSHVLHKRYLRSLD